MSKRFSDDPASVSGKIVLSKEARKVLGRQALKRALERHFACDWGNVSDDEWKRNDYSFKTGGVITARCISPEGIPLVLITDSERLTTVHLSGAVREGRSSGHAAA